LVGKGADSGHDLLPVLEVRIVDKVPQVLTDNGGEKTQVVGGIRLPLEVGRLRLGDALLTTTDGNHKRIRQAVLLEAYV
jgi:hypothetical protein